MMTSTTNGSILNSIGECILVIDSNFNVLDANSHLLDSINLSERDVVGKPCYEVTHCSLPDGDCPLSELLKTGKSSTKRRICHDKNGTKVYTEVTIYPLVERGNNDKFIHIGRDVTERVRVEGEVKEYIGKLSKKIGGVQ